MFNKQESKIVDGMLLEAHNEVDNRGRWHLSYNPRTDGYGCVTTALVFDNNLFFILRGDHREEWGKAADLDAALGYFMAHEKQVHRMSEHLMALAINDDPFDLRYTLRDMLTGEQYEAMRDYFKRTDHESN